MTMIPMAAATGASEQPDEPLLVVGGPVAASSSSTDVDGPFALDLASAPGSTGFSTALRNRSPSGALSPCA